MNELKPQKIHKYTIFQYVFKIIFLIEGLYFLYTGLYMIIIIKESLKYLILGLVHIFGFTVFLNLSFNKKFYE